MAFRRSFVAALFVSVAGCVAAPPQPKPTPPLATPTPRPTSTPTPVPTYTSWMDVPQTPGDWRYGPIAGGTAGSFGEAASEPRFAIRCLRRGEIELVRYGNFAGDDAMTVRTESVSRRVAGLPMTDNPSLRAVLPASDSLLDAMAFSKGRFAIEARGVPTLIISASPAATESVRPPRAMTFEGSEIGRVIGRAGDRARHRGVVRAALELFTRETPPGKVVTVPL